MEEKLAEAAAAVERSEDCRPPGPRAAPWLVFSHRIGIENDQFFFNICEPNKVYNKTVPEMNRQSFDYWQYPSHEGWLVILCVVDEYNSNSKSKKLGDSFLWNLASLEIVELPSLGHWIRSDHYHIRSCLLSLPPTNSNSMVFCLISGDCSTNTELVFCRPGHKEWSRHKFDDISNKPQTLLWFKGKLYLTCLNDQHLEIEILGSDNDETQISIRSFVIKKTIQFPASRIGIHTPVIISHVESNGELFMVVQLEHPCVGNEVVHLQVCKFNMSLMEWEEVRSLGDHVLFLGRNTKASCSAAEMGLTKGCVYYVTPGDETSLYKFELEDYSISVSLPSPNLAGSSVILPDWVTIPIVNRGIGKNLLKEDKKKEVQKNNVVHWLTSSSEMLMIPSLSPWLVFLKKDETICYFVDPMHDSKKYLMNLSELLLDATIRFSKGGWLLMFDGTRTLFFFNPFTREIILLPELPDKYSNKFIFTGLCFSSLPTSPDCVVFAITEWYENKVNICLILRGVESWINVMPENTKIPYTERSMEFMTCLNNPVYHEKAFYCLDQDGTLGVFHYSHDDLKWRVLDKPRRPCTSIYQSFLVECGGELLSVFLGHLGKWVQVFKLDFSKMEWVEVQSLGKHMLFISHTSCLSAIASNNLMENKIFFSRFHGEGILFYSLDTGMYHSTANGQYSAKDFYNTKENLNCSWIEPNWAVNTVEKYYDWLNI